MNGDFFRKNVAALTDKAPDIADELMRAPIGNAYSGVQQAKTGVAVPVLKSQQALHSLYNPEKEAERLISESTDGFMLFCGIGAGIHIRLFLTKYPHAYCAITESDYASFRQLLHLLDYSDIFVNPRVFLLPPCSHSLFKKTLMQTYLPVLYGTFHCHILRVWKLFFTAQTVHLISDIEDCLVQIRADFSVQVHFGKIWMRNIFLNLQIASYIQPVYPSIDTKRTALILGAGPSLEQCLPVVQKDRTSYTIFCTDTAFSVLACYGIVPDFFISIDPQHISYSHILHTFSNKMIGIFDLCANAAVVRQFYAKRNSFFFIAGGHPLTQYAAAYSPFPFLDTGSGTVSIAAYYAAQALGFSRIECSGMDFSYTNGKAYACGTYLSHQYAYTVVRSNPEETLFTRLMFRTSSYTKKTAEGLTYCNEVLDSYAYAFANRKEKIALWKNAYFSVFPYSSFIQYFKEKIRQHDDSAYKTLLPYIAWHNQRYDTKKTKEELALEVLSEYTGVK